MCGSTDYYVTKELLVEDMISCNKIMCKEKVPPVVQIRKWVIAVREAGHVLGKLVAKTSSSSRVKSGSVIKEKLAVLEMQANPNKADIDEILADIPKVEKYQNPMEIKYSITCLSFGLANCTNTFCVANK